MRQGEAVKPERRLDPAIAQIVIGLALADAERDFARLVQVQGRREDGLLQVSPRRGRR